MTEPSIRELVIAGAGAAAASTAAAVAVSLQGTGVGITLVLAPSQGGQRSIEVVRGGSQSLHELLGVSESALLEPASAVFGLGTRYRRLFSTADDIFVPLGSHGRTLRLVDFHHYVAKLRAEGDTLRFNDWSMAAAAARAGQFSPAKNSEYDLYVDHDSYLNSMLTRATSLGVRLVEQVPANVTMDDTGMLESLTLADDSSVHGDFFIDCSQDRALIRHLASDDTFDDWSRWLPADRRLSISASPQATPNLFATIEADDAGWTRQLSTRASSEHTFVYESSELDDDEAIRRLVAQVPGADSDDAHSQQIRSGRHARHWEMNCLAIGPGAAVFAPMEVSSLKLTHSAILRFLAMAPRHKDSPMLAAEFNRITNAELDGARDYQLLRLALSNRRAGPFWRRMQAVEWPESLQHRIELFRARGRFTPRDNEFFTKSNWISSFINAGLWPASYDPLADMIDERQMRNELVNLKKVSQTVS